MLWVECLSYPTIYIHMYMQFIRFDLFSDSVTACCCARGCNALNHCAIEDLFLSLISLVITESDSVLLRDVVEAHWLAWSMRLSSGVNYSCIQTALILQTHRHQSGELRDGNEMWWVSFSMQSKWKALGFCWDGSIVPLLFNSFWSVSMQPNGEQTYACSSYTYVFQMQMKFKHIFDCMYIYYNSQ